MLFEAWYFYCVNLLGIWGTIAWLRKCNSAFCRSNHVGSVHEVKKPLKCNDCDNAFSEKGNLNTISNQFIKDTSHLDATFAMLVFLRKHTWIVMLNQFTKVFPSNAMFVMKVFLIKEILLGILNKYMQEKIHSNVMIATKPSPTKEVWISILNLFMKEWSHSNVIFVMQARFSQKDTWIVMLNQFTKERSPSNLMLVKQLFLKKDLWMSMSNQFMKKRSHSNVTFVMQALHEELI